MPALYAFTFAVNMLGLVLAIWLGLYLITRSPKLGIAWLTALTLWSMAGVFLNVLLAITPPPGILYHPEIMRFVFLFWPPEILAESHSHWLQGWSVAPAVVFWHHATILMRPGGVNVWRWVRIWTGYSLAILAIIAQANASILYSPVDSDPLYLNSLQAGPWYVFFGVALVILTLYSAVNLFRSARSAPSKVLRKSFQLMAFATLVAAAVAPFSIAGSIRGMPVPMVVISLTALTTVIIFGYDVARYSAIMEGHTIQRDFFYNLLLLGLVVLVYLSVSAILVVVYQAPGAIIIFIPVLAVVTHSLMSTAARLLDRMFFRQEARQLRSNLQRLMRLAVEGADFDERLEQTLESLCTSVDATYGMILTFHEGVVWQVTTYHWYGGPITIKTTDLSADDIVHLAPGQFQPPLEEAALLVPLYAEAEQVGALLLGRPMNGIRYSQDEVTGLLNLTDRMGEIIASAYQKAEKMSQIARLAEPSAVTPAAAALSSEIVEDALRNLYDYTWLADSPLAHMELVSASLPEGKITHLERGKAVHHVVLQAIDKLRPGEEIPNDPPPREWYPYRILYDAYLGEISNREIMMRLYISEGTFNRTRRSAIRSLARALGEMDEATA